MTFEVLAPGKVVLVGEYAVLDGAPAVVAAVDRGVRCAVAPSDLLAIETPGDDSFVRAALAGAPPAKYRFSDWNPTRLRSKPGLGGSAAAVVAATLAASAAGGAPLAPGPLADRATAVHREVQGSGSGLDVAASAHGGVLRFQSGAVRPLPPVAPVVVWSGASARTGPRVEAYLRWADRDAFVTRSAAIAEAFSDDPVAALRAATRLLESMTTAARIPWWTDALRLISLTAARFGGAAKPSGAGGGDIAVALFPDPDRRAAFEAALDASGIPRVPVALAAGATVLRDGERGGGARAR